MARKFRKAAGAAGLVLGILASHMNVAHAQHRPRMAQSPSWIPQQGAPYCPPGQTMPTQPWYDPSCPPAMTLPPSSASPGQLIPSPPESAPDASLESGAAQPNTTTPQQQLQTPAQNQFNQPPVQQQQFNNALASVDSGSRAGRAPNMIGDLFNTGGYHGVEPYSTLGGPAFPFDTLPTGSLASAPGGNVGRIKLSENTSPIPRDRVFVNYSYFNNTNLTPTGPTVNRITPGLEKTFVNGNVSLEGRFPFATTVSNTVVQGVPLDEDSSEMGNMSFYLKALLWDNQDFAFTSGLGMTVPTAEDFSVVSATGQQVLNVSNESIHLLPFIGTLYTPSDRFFAQGMLQLDVDTNGNPVSIAQNYDPATGVYEQSVLQDRTFLFIDVAFGYWMYLDNQPNAMIRGIAPVVELHFNESLDGGDPVVGPTVSVSSPGQLSVFNAVFGVSTNLGENCNLTVGYATPVSGDEQFDAEWRVLFNWIPGRSVNSVSRRTGVY